MSAKAQRELIKGGPRTGVNQHQKASKAGKATDIPASNHTERERIIARLKARSK